MLKIETWNDNKILRSISEEIKPSEYKKFIKLWNEMIKYIKEPKNMWVWLAAPQVWYNKRMIVVSLLKDWDCEESFKTIMMLNPVIIEHWDDTNLDVEGCLSVPGKKWKVKRFNSIRVEYIDKNWKPQILLLEWLRARIVQHEVDHLNGVLFTDITK